MEKLKINSIYNINCLDGIKKIPDNSIDTVICDPPYFQGLTYNGKKSEFIDLITAEPFFKELSYEINRILNEEAGSVYWFCDFRGYAFYFPILNEFLNIKNTLVWDKHSGPGNFYSYSHEFIIFGTNNSKFGYGKKPGRNVINNIPSFTTGSRAKEGNGDKVHPTQKTVEIIEKFILDSTEEGGTVLDCFGGSGTTAVAAKKTGRNYILFEIQKKYCDIAKRRIEQI